MKSRAPASGRAKSRRPTPRVVALATLGLVSVLAVGLAAQQGPEVSPYQIAPNLSPQVIGADNVRVVPPTPRVRITPDNTAQVDEDTPLRSDFVDRPSVDSIEAARARRAQRARNRARETTSDDDDDGAARALDRATRRETVRQRMETAQADGDDDEAEASGRSQGSLRHAPGARSHTERRGRHSSQRDEEREYGRLIIVTSFEDDVRATVDGEPYPYASLDGVLLVAGYQYDVVIERADEAGSAASSSSETSNFRTIPVRLAPGETRILMASLSDSSSGVRASSPRTRTPTRTSRRADDDDEDEEEEEIGYLGVSSTPVGTIWIDGENIGQTTPARRIELEPGRHEVRIFYDSEDEFSETKNVLIRAGVNTNVFFRQRRNRDADDDE